MAVVNADVGAPIPIKVIGEEDAARSFAAFLETTPSLRAVADWLFDRGLKAEFSLPEAESP